MRRLYVARMMDGTLKIGQSRVPARRIKQIPGARELIYVSKFCENCDDAERLAHRLAALCGQHFAGERFHISQAQAVECVKVSIEQAGSRQLQLGVEVQTRGKRHGMTERLDNPLVVRAPRDLIDKVDAEAKADMRSRNSEILVLLAEALEARQASARRVAA